MTRKSIYNVITPLARTENLTPLLSMLAPQRIKWHVITDDDRLWHPAFIGNCCWARNYICPNRENTFYNRCNFAINWFLDAYPPSEYERYLILNDDDAYPPGFFDQVDAVDCDVLIVSMDRGDQTPRDVTPERAHAATRLMAAPQNMFVGGVGVEQIIIRGGLLRKVRLPLEICGDGRMIEYCVKTFGAQYLPEASVWFNYFEPGRWNKTSVAS